MSEIHATAIIHPDSQIGDNAYIGPYSVIGGNVKLGAGVKLHSHVVVDGNTIIGNDSEIFPFASIGHAPQDLKYKGEESTLTIGERVVIREHVTMNPGTEKGGMKTEVGNDCLFMTASHVAHDCKVGNNVILANNATLAGHVEVGDNAVIGGLSAVHQFVRIGTHAMIGGMSGVAADVMPYASVMGERANLAGLNLVGMKRHDMPRDEIHALRNAYKQLFDDDAEGTLLEKVENVRISYAESEAVQNMLNFFLADTSRSFCLPKKASGG